MKIVVKEIESWKKQLEVEVPVEDMGPVIEKTYQKYQKHVKLDGFRKGKVPMSIIKERFAESVEADASEDLVKEFYIKAIEEHDLPVVAPGEIKDVQYEKDKPLRFTAEVEVEPEIKVSNYKHIKAEKTKVDVTDDDVTEVINAVLNQHAQWIEVEGGANKGDMVEGDMQGIDETGVPIVGQKWNNSSVVLGEPPLGGLLEDQLLSAQVGDERRLRITPPDEKGKPIQEETKHFLMTVKTVKEKKLPELTDEFVKEKLKIDTVDALKDRIRDNLTHEWTRDAEEHVRQQLIDEVLKKNDFELPPSMIENALDRLWKDYEKHPHQHQHQHLDEKAYKEQNKPMVIFNLKWQLVWPKIAELEQIEISDEMIDAEIDEMVKSNDKEAKKIQVMFKKPERRENLKTGLQEKEVFLFLEEHGKIKNISRKDKNKQSPIIRA